MVLSYANFDGLFINQCWVVVYFLWRTTSSSSEKKIKMVNAIWTHIIFEICQKLTTTQTHGGNTSFFIIYCVCLFVDYIKMTNFSRGSKHFCVPYLRTSWFPGNVIKQNMWTFSYSSHKFFFSHIMLNSLAIHDFPFQIAYDAWHTWEHNYSNFSNNFRGMKSTFCFAHVMIFSIIIFELFHCTKKNMFKYI